MFVTELDFQRKYPVVDRLKLTRKSYGKKTLNVQLFIKRDNEDGQGADIKFKFS